MLIVEDDIDIREALDDVLRREGYDVAQAGHGRDALEALRGGMRPCVVLLDLMMPVMSGWEFLEAAGAERLAPVPVIVLTANARRVDDTLRSRVDAVVPKPVDLDVLLESVRIRCARSRETD